MQKLGYACINMHLSYPKQRGSKDKPVTTNRSMIRRTFEAKGLHGAGELALQNAQDLLKVLKWNDANGIRFYRMSSDMVPWCSEYEFTQLPQWSQIGRAFRQAGDWAQERGHRLTFHPGPFNALGSPNPSVVQNTIVDLTRHGQIMDTMGLSRSPWNKINIHMGGVYGDKQATGERWCQQFEKLPDEVRSRLTLENDDKASMWSVQDLLPISKRCGVPIVFDIHHHNFCTGGLSHLEAAELAAQTWPQDIVPVVHYSESRADEFGDPSIRPQAHSDFIYNSIDISGVDIMIEAKQKEQALLKWKTLIKE